MGTNPSTPKLFGSTPDGRAVHLITLQGDGLTANIMTYGASVQDLRLTNHPAPLVLGFNEFAPYLNEGKYFGATVGRFANRIAEGRIVVDGITYQLDQNSDDVNTLHGGSGGISQQVWDIVNIEKDHTTLKLNTPNLSMGFPGACEHICTYALRENGVLEVSYETTSDAKTVAGLAHHSYFVLDKSGDCLDHELQIEADHYLPVDVQLIPAGGAAPVGNTPFDFRTPKQIKADLDNDTIYDHNFCLSDQRTSLRDVASVRSSNSSVSLNVATTEPGLQFYAAHALKTNAKGLNGEPYKAYSGFCLETQVWPDAPNRPDFPNSILSVGETLRQVTQYQFMKN